MKKIWEKKKKVQTDELAEKLNSSIAVDKAMVFEDIEGSAAHVTMLSKCKIITADEAKQITDALNELMQEIKSGSVKVDESFEDVHSFIESKITAKIDFAAKKMHTARSRNDQVCLDLKMYARKKGAQIKTEIKKLLSALAQKSEQELETIMPGFTHMQHAQPITAAHYLMAYAAMFKRDADRLTNYLFRLQNEMPLGACALAGTTYLTDRNLVANLLGFSGITLNSLDSVADRDFVIELSGIIAIIMMHLSRFCEELIIFNSTPFKYVEIDDKFCTGSSIMPQKKNPDIAELIRGKTGRTYGNLISILTIMKALPLSYNKDLQEDKEGIFDSITTVIDCLQVFTKMLASLKFNSESMLKSAKDGFLNATDCADYLVKKGMPFREAYQVTGEVVDYCVQSSKTLEELKIEEYQKFSNLFEKDIYEAIEITNCVEKRVSAGGPAKVQVEKQIEEIKKYEQTL